MTDLRTSVVEGFGKRLASERKRRGLTQADLAELLGHSSPETVSRYERGEREPRLSTVVEIATALGVPHTRLFASESGGAIEDTATTSSRIARYLVQECGFSTQSATLAARLALTAHEELDFG